MCPTATSRWNWRIRSRQKEGLDLTKAEVIVSAGRGIGKKDNIPLIAALAKALGGELGATRPVVDAGWLDHSHQVGTTGQIVHPKLYMACGISGSIQHLAGMKQSDYIVAINKDKDAPIGTVADVLVVADVLQFVPVLTTACRSKVFLCLRADRVEMNNMDLELNEEQKIIQTTAREFARAELEPVAARLDQIEDRGTFLENIRKLADLGFMGLNIREEYGGAHAGMVAFSAAITELARACASTAVTVSVTNLVANVIQAAGSETQKQTYLPKLCSGEYPAGSFALSEPEAGSDPASITTTAVPDGSGWVLNGLKRFITSAPYAGLFVVWAVTNRAAPRGKGHQLLRSGRRVRPA